VLVHQANEPEPSEVWRARHALARWLADQGIAAHSSQTAILVVSELVTNAVRHARTAFTVSAEIAGDCLRIEVFDRDTRPPVLQGPDGHATGGRGMQIIATIAEQWGVQTEERDGIPGKVVWAVAALDR
jgi:two-component sensor histidine kinase